MIAPVGVGAPRQADLKRAISTAYYAVFHAVLTEASDEFVGKTQRQSPRYALVYRSVGHGQLKSLCVDISKRTPPTKYRPYIPPGGFGPDVQAFATALADLQEKRHTADYDPLARFSRADALFAASTARNAVARLASAGGQKKKAFLTLVAFTPWR